MKTKKAVPLKKRGDFGTGLTVDLSGIKAVKADAKVPGEIAGPALEVTLVARNRSSAAIPVDRFVVSLAYGKDRAPASALTDGASPLTRSVAAGASTKGTYVFSVPSSERKLIRVEVSYSGKAPTVAFEGSVD